MNHYRSILPLLLIFLLNISCSKEPELLSGKISGCVNFMDAGYNASYKLTGIRMTLKQDERLIASDTTPENTFTFDHIPYGKYLLTAEKEGCIPASRVVEHIGGYSPTITTLWIYQIPSFTLSMDSVVQTDSYYVNVYGQLGNYNIKAYIGLVFLCFVNDNPTVDADHYTQKMVAFAAAENISGNRITARINNDYGFQAAPGDTLFLRTYPMSWGENLYNFHKQYLGNPSNVTSFIVRF